MKIVVLGANGMFGHVIFDYLASCGEEVHGTIRSPEASRLFPEELQDRLICNVHASKLDSIEAALKQTNAEVVINCIGIIKQLPTSGNHEKSILINALFPHQLARICDKYNARLIHISTDCVFNGKAGNYGEDSLSNAEDLYGKTKYLGEVIEYSNAVTLRTSIIGHELSGHVSLVDWFLMQENKIKGYSEAWYSGFPSVVLARIIQTYVLPDKSLSGLYQVSSNPINKYDLLKLIAKTYGKEIEIVPDNNIKINRILNSRLFQSRTGYAAPSWKEMVEAMYASYRDMGQRYRYMQYERRG